MSTGLNTLFRKELGVNLSNSRSFTETETPLVKVISKFIERDVSQVSPGLKTVITRNNENIPVRYHMSTLKTISKILCWIFIVILLFHFHTKHSTKHQESKPFDLGHLFTCEVFES